MTDLNLINTDSNASSKRCSGILLHPTSLPSKYGIGDLGQDAYHFIDYLVSAGQSLWQVLPLGPTGYGDSPYQAFSAFAGQPLLISPDELEQLGLLESTDLEDYPHFSDKFVEYGPVITQKTELLKKAYHNFSQSVGSLKEEYIFFCKNNMSWLDDYSLFMSLKEKNNQKCWLEWEIEDRQPSAEQKAELMEKLKESVQYYQFIQFIFFKQWFALKAYANKNGIKIIGDIPIFVSPDSCDVWANQSLFQLDSEGYPTVVAGVPPDYFSTTGQLWGNPLYDWDAHEKDGYKWWIERIRCQMKLVDYVRIDHFRGFDSYWAVPYGEQTAINGKWMEGPKEKLFNAVVKALGKQLPIWAEDLGVITEDIRKLRDQFEFPGMKILQFAFEELNDNDMMPAHHIPNCICYTGTHDNNTTLGWYYHASPDKRKNVRQFMHCGAALMPWAFIRCAMESVADYVIIPMQDILCLDSKSRMNTPGIASGNWSFRYEPQELDMQWAAYLKELTLKNKRLKRL